YPSPSQYPSRNPFIISCDDVTTFGKTNDVVLLREPRSDIASHRQSFWQIARETTRTLKAGTSARRNPDGTVTGSTRGALPGNASVTMARNFSANASLRTVRHIRRPSWRLPSEAMAPST